MTSYQAQAWLGGFGDIWLNNNRKEMGSRDPVSEIIGQQNLPLGNVLEVGCSTGWRLKKLRKKYGCTISGIDPSFEAVKEANEPTIVRGTVDSLPFKEDEFNTIIMGFCLYAIGPEDWFKMLAETDRVLKDGGIIIIWDFLTARPFKKKLAKEDVPLFMYYWDWSKLWTINPVYRLIAEQYRLKDAEGVSVLQKSYANAFTLAPSA